MVYTQFNPANIQALLTDYPQGQPLYIAHLLCFKKTATYDPPRPDLPPISGAEAYNSRYLGALFPVLSINGAKPIIIGSGLLSLVGPEGEKWDEVGVVEFPNAAAFVEMVTSEHYVKEAQPHRDAAVENWKMVPFAKLGP
jgi:uncharacterized protein (DUF1330 family)